MNVKFVRWLGAFGKQADVLTSARWELSQQDREVAVEPLWKGQTQLHAGVGLVVDHVDSSFVKGYLHDAFTTVDENGRLRGTRLSQKGGKNGIRSIDRFLACFNAQEAGWHGEAIFRAGWKASAVAWVECPRLPNAESNAVLVAQALGLPLIKIGKIKEKRRRK